MEQTFSLKRLLITVGIVILAAGAVGGTTWYLMDKNAKAVKEQYEKQIRELEEQRDQKETTKATLTKEDDETADWKTYISKKYGFTIKYPSDWTYGENESTSSGNQYWGGNVFSANNVIFKNAAKQVGIGLNMEDILGRGGICAKRTVTYKPTITANKLSLTKKGDVTEAAASDDNLMCEGPNSGYIAAVEQFKEGGVQYFLHSESSSVADSVVSETIEIFEKMMKTLTFK